MKALFVCFGVWLAFAVNGAAVPPWKQILGPPQGKLPRAASYTVTWRTNLARAMAEARKENRPLFVTFRCLPCKQFGIPADTMAVEPFMGKGTNGPGYLAGLRGNHIVTAVNGESPNLTGRAFLVWFVQKYDRGDRVTVTVMDRPGQRRDLTYQLPPPGQ